MWETWEFPHFPHFNMPDADTVLLMKTRCRLRLHKKAAAVFTLGTTMQNTLKRDALQRQNILYARNRRCRKRNHSEGVSGSAMASFGFRGFLRLGG